MSEGKGLSRHQSRTTTRDIDQEPNVSAKHPTGLAGNSTTKHGREALDWRDQAGQEKQVKRR